MVSNTRSACNIANRCLSVIGNIEESGASFHQVFKPSEGLGQLRHENIVAKNFNRRHEIVRGGWDGGASPNSSKVELLAKTWEKSSALVPDENLIWHHCHLMAVVLLGWNRGGKDEVKLLEMFLGRWHNLKGNRSSKDFLLMKECLARWGTDLRAEI